MAKKVINAFNNGEVSPYVYSRYDDELYNKSCLKLENFIPLSYGGADRRPATAIVPTQDYTSECLLKEFIFNDTNVYLFIFSNLSVSIYENDVLLYSVTTDYTTAQLSELQFTQSNNVLFIAHSSHPVKKISRITEIDSQINFIYEELEFKKQPMLDLKIGEITFTAGASSGVTTLSTNSTFFTSGVSEETELLIEQFRDNKEQSFKVIDNATPNAGDIFSAGKLVSEPINVSFCTYRVDVTGTNFSGRVVIEKSTDGGHNFQETFTVIDTSAGQIANDKINAGTYNDASFSTNVEEEKNTFIKVRFIPSLFTGTGTGVTDNTGYPNITITPSSLYVKGLFKITNVTDSSNATGEWLSPIIDTPSEYLNKTWTAGTAYTINEKIRFSGELTESSDFPTGSSSANQAIPSGGETVSGSQTLDITFDPINSAIYVITDTNHINRYSYDRSDGTIAYSATKALSLPDQFNSSFNTGINTVANQAYFGIAYYNSKLYLLRRNATGHSSLRHNSEIYEVDLFAHGATGTITSGTKKWERGGSDSGYTCHNAHGLSYGNGYFYWREHWSAASSKWYQRTAFCKVSADFSTLNSDPANLISYSIFGSSAKSSPNGGTAYTTNFTLLQEPTGFKRNMVDSVYNGNSLLCLNDLNNRLDIRDTDFNDTGLSYALTTNEFYVGLAGINKNLTIGANDLGIGTRYRITSLGGSGTNQSNASGQPHWNSIAGSTGTTYAVNDTFIAVNTGSSLHANADGIVVLDEGQHLDNATDTELDYILLSQGSNASNTTNKPSSPSPVFRKFATSGTPAYYEAQADHTSASSFTADLAKGLWARRYPNLDRYQESAFSIKNGFPKAIAIHENRLCLAGAKENPNRLFMSVTDDLNNFMTGVSDTAAIDLTFNSLTQDVIQWLVSSKELVIGTAENEWTLSAGIDQLPITPSSFNLKRRSQYGSSSLQAKLIGNSVIYLMRQKETLRSWQRKNRDDYIGLNLTYLAEHILRGGVKQFAIQRQPETIIWIVRNDGQLIGLTYDLENNNVGWHRHIISTGNVESVAVLPNPTNEDDVYIKCKNSSTTSRYLLKLDKTIWGSTYTTEYNGMDSYISLSGFTGQTIGQNTLSAASVDSTGLTDGNIRLVFSANHNLRVNDKVTLAGIARGSEFESDSTSADFATNNEDPNGTFVVQSVVSDVQVRVTSAVQEIETFNVSSATCFNNQLSHLKSKEVKVKIDGVVQSATFNVTSAGVLDLGTSHSNKTVVIGLNYTSTLAPLYLGIEYKGGSTKGGKTSIHKANIHFKDTLSAKVGQTETALDSVRFASSTLLNNESARCYINNANDYLNTLYVVQDEPQPCTILSAIAEIEGGK